MHPNPAIPIPAPLKPSQMNVNREKGDFSKHSVLIPPTKCELRWTQIALSPEYFNTMTISMHIIYFMWNALCSLGYFPTIVKCILLCCRLVPEVREKYIGDTNCIRCIGICLCKDSPFI